MNDFEDFSDEENELVEEKRLTFIEHLEELRKRIINCLIGFLIATVISFFYSDRLIDILFAPCKNSIKVTYYGSILTPFNIRLKVSSGAGIIIASPYILYQLWMFIEPALKRNEKKVVRILFSFAILCFLVGVAIAYFWIIPIGVPILLQYATPIMQPLIGIEEYISFVIIILVAMGIVFETPLILIGLSKIGLVTSAQLSRNRRYAILLAAILACIITPGSELWTSIFLIIPLYLLFEISVWLIAIIEKR
ncbi:MAG: twin-arginine translocase subunit TatC [bacterium]|nr:twin-arginine translocase subunit TatC [bacterium]